MTNEAVAIIEYAPSNEPAEPTLGITTTSVRANFGALSKWFYAMQIANGILPLIKLFLICGFLAWFEIKWHRQFGTPFLIERYFAIIIMTALCCHAGFVWFLVYPLWRWGRVPRILIATAEGLTLSDMGWFKPRERYWPVEKIDSIVLYKTWKNRLTGRSHARIRIRFNQYLPLVIIPFSVADAAIPVRMAEKLSQQIGRPLQIRGLRETQTDDFADQSCAVGTK